MRAVACLFAMLALAAVAPACVAQGGDGRIHGELDVPECWSGEFDLEPNFFGASPFDNTLTLRIQRDSDFFTYADGVAIVIDDLARVRGGEGKADLYGTPLAVGLPPGVTPPGTPLPLVESPPFVYLNLYLQKTCRTQNIALYAADSVRLAPDGGCFNVETTCGAGTDGAESPPLGRSTITFDTLFDGDILASGDEQRRIKGRFDVYLTDPRHACVGQHEPPPCRGHLSGEFDYLYTRSRPYQPFP